MIIDATFWVAVSFFIFLGGLVYLKVPQKINNSLNEKKEVNGEKFKFSFLRIFGAILLNDPFAQSNNIFSGKTLSTKIIEDVETIIDKRLEELTPQHIKSIIKEIIHKHLGWLVVWGGIFGFVIGIIIGVIGI